MPRSVTEDSARASASGSGRWGLIGAVFSLATIALTGCHSTVDSLGYDGPTGLVINHLTPRPASSYLNAFRDVLGKTNTEISDKIADTFNQLFHGDASNQAIYFTVAGQDQAYIKDIYHGDIRTDGMGLGMLIAVELDKQDEFDRLWNFARANMQVQSGPNKGYFLSSCSTSVNPGVYCFDSYGPQQMLMALLLANDRWGSPDADAGVMLAAADAGTAAPIDYAAGARDLLTVMRHKVDQNGGIVGGVTDLFDPVTALVFDQPDVSHANLTRPAIELPGFYDLWAQATGDSFWNRAAGAGRDYWKRAASQGTTGLVPAGSHFDGSLVAGSDTFSTEAYRALVNFVIDDIWAPIAPTVPPATTATSTTTPAAGDRSWDVDEADLVLQFFIGADINQYGREFTLNGVTVDPAREIALVAANGTLGLISTIGRKSDFIQAVWDMETPTGSARYFPGTMQLMALLLLGGQFQIY